MPKSGPRLVIKLLARAGKYKFGARTGIYKFGARDGNQDQGWGPSKGPGSGKYKDPKKMFLLSFVL